MKEIKNSIKEGDEVWLKSGGPKMTVKHENVLGEWVCNWFVNNELKTGLFKEGQLTHKNPKEFRMV